MDLLELIESYGYSPEQRGMEHWMSCPFHEDNNPSFSVSPTETGYVWYCFSCKRGGGSVQFIQYQDKIGPAEAKSVWDKLNGRKVKPNLLKVERTQQIEQSQELPPEVYQFMAERNVGRETLRRYKIGWDSGSKSILYPFYDYDGVAKVHSRQVDEKFYRGEKPNMLWGLYQIAYGLKDPVWMVEGYHDVMALSEQDIPAVAMCGTTIHSEYWKQLSDHEIRNVFLCPDGDAAGRAVLQKMLEQGWPQDMQVFYVEMPEGKDPDDIDLERFQVVPEVPLLWYVRHNWEDHPDAATAVAMYEDIAKYVVQLSASQREAIRPWFVEHMGSEAIDYLYGVVKPDLLAEAVTIGNCLYSTTIRAETLAVLTEDCFHILELKNEFIFVRDNDGPTPELFKSQFSSEPKVDLVNYRAYIDKIFEIRSREKVIRAMERARANIQSTNPEHLVGALVEDLYSFLDADTLVHSGSDVARRVIIEVNEKVENPDVIGIPFSEDRFPIINRSLLGYVPNKLILLSGLTGHGKTNVACNWIDDLIFEKNQRVLFCSLEMTPEELIQRQLTIRSGIASIKIMTGSLEQSEYDRLVETAKRMLNDNLKILYGTYNLHKLVGIMRAQIMRNRVRVIFLDYVQLVSLDNDKARWEQLMEITKVLKTRVCPLGVTVVAVSQLNRSAINSEIPEASAQAGSFGMLADPDVAITIKRRQPEAGSNFLFFIDKHRYGVDQILINGAFDRQTLQIKEVS